MDDDCPRCHCNDIEHLRDSARWGKPIGLWACNFCGHNFEGATLAELQPAPPPPPPPNLKSVAFVTVRCPVCSSARVLTTSTRRPVRMHKCQACEHTFKSVESSR